MEDFLEEFWFVVVGFFQLKIRIPAKCDLAVENINFPLEKKKKKVVFDLLLVLLGQKLGSFSAKKHLALGQMILH